MQVDESILDDLDEVYDVPEIETPEPPKTIDIEKLHELELRWAEKANEIKQKQQATEIELGVKVLDFINTARKHVREEQAELAKAQADLLQSTNKLADEKKGNLHDLIEQFKGG